MRYNSLRESLDHVKAEYLARCTNCGLCVEACPVYELGDWDRMAPHKLHEGRLAAVHDGVVSDVVYHYTFTCANCAACKDSCPEGLDPFEFTHLIRTAIVESGRPAPANLQIGMPSRRDSLPQVAAALQVRPDEIRWLTEVPKNPPQADIVLFLGCNVHAMPDKIYTLIDVLATLGLRIPVVGGIGLCCGAVELLCGDAAAAENRLRRLVDTLARFRPHDVVFWCADCYNKMLHEVPAFMEVPFRSQHIAKFILAHLDGVRFEEHLDRTIAVHDPCSLGRMVGEYEPVRQLLAALPGVQLVEMGKSRDQSLCCGSTTQGAAPRLAAALTRRTLNEAAASGATTLATVCHGCQRRFVRDEPSQPFKVESFITLLGEALGIRYEDRLKRYIQYRDPERVIADASEYIAVSDYPRPELERLVRMYFR